MSRSLGLAAALVAAAAPARADVLRVPQDFLHIQPAVNNAGPGDIVLIAPGTWPEPIEVDGKSLTIVSDGGHVTVPRIHVHDLAEGQVVTLRGVGATGSKSLFPLGPFEEGLVVEHCAGRIVIEDATFLGMGGMNHSGLSGTPLFHPSGWHAADVVDARSVEFLRCTFIGGTGASIIDEQVHFGAGSGGHGLRAEQSDVGLHGCLLTGGAGGYVDDTVSSGGGDGGDGARFLSGILFAAASGFSGLSGGSGDCSFFACGSGGDGGNGVAVGPPAAGASADLWHLACDFAHGNGGSGGQGSTGGASPGSPGVDGTDVLLVGGSEHALARRTRGFVATGPTREGQDAGFTWTGWPGDLALAWVSPQVDWELLPSQQGVLLVDRGSPGALELVAGPLGADGLLSASYPVPDLGPGTEGLVLHAQGVFLVPGGVRLGPASVVVLLDAGL